MQLAPAVHGMIAGIPSSTAYPTDHDRADQGPPVPRRAAVTDPLELEADAPLTEDEAGYVEAARAANTLRGYRSDWAEFTGWCAARAASTYPASSSVSGASASSSSGSVTGRSTRYWRSLVGSVMIGRIGGARRDSGDHPVYRRRQLHPSSASGKANHRYRPTEDHSRHRRGLGARPRLLARRPGTKGKGSTRLRLVRVSLA